MNVCPPTSTTRKRVCLKTHSLAHRACTLRIVLVCRFLPLAQQPPRLRQTWMNRLSDSPPRIVTHTRIDGINSTALESRAMIE